MGDNWKVHFWKKKKKKKKMAFLLETLGGGDFFLSFLGDDGGKRPTPQQMAMATAVKSREDEIRKVMEENSKTWGHVDDETFDKVDLNDDGKIPIDEFLKWSLGE